MSEANSRDVAAWTEATKSGTLDDGRATPQAERDRLRHRGLLQQAFERFHAIVSNPQEQRQRAQELEDLRFDRGRREDHWPQDMLEARKGGSITADGVAFTIAERPSLVINKLTVPVTQVENEGRQARLEPVVKPKPGKTNEKDAEVAQGLIRAIGIASNAQAARDWAFQRAVRCGRGYYRVDLGYANDGDFDLDILILLIKNQGSVYVDPFHSQPDASDAAFAFITEDLPFDEARTRYPGLSTILSSYSQQTSEFTSLTDKEKSWLNGPTGTVRVAEYWHVEESLAWIVEGYDERFAAKPTAEAMAEIGPLVVNGMARDRRVRQVARRQVKWCLIGPGVVLAEHEWPGRYIPVVQVVGRMSNVDGEMSYKGVITDAKDAQRVYNYGVSAAVETVAILPRAPWVAAFGQIERFKKLWALANQRAFSHLPYDPVVPAGSGTLAPPPQRTNVSADLSGAASLIAQADADIKATTGRWDASLGNVNPQERSGKALRELKMQGELGASHFLSNFAQAIRHECGIILDLIPKVYTEPGRVARLVGDEPGKERDVLLNQPFVRDAQGRPVPAPTGAAAFLSRARARMTGQPVPQPETFHVAAMDFGGVVVDVAPGHRTQRDENLSFLQGLIDADPNLAPLLADIMAEEMGGPMARKVSARLRSVNPNLKGDDESPLPPEAQAQIAALEQQLQEMGQALQAAQMAAQVQEAKQRAQVQVAQIKEQGAAARVVAQMEAERQTARERLEAEIAVLREKFAGDERLAEFEAAMAKALQDDEQRHEQEMLHLRGILDAQSQARQAVREDVREAREPGDAQ